MIKNNHKYRSPLIICFIIFIMLPNIVMFFVISNDFDIFCEYSSCVIRYGLDCPEIWSECPGPSIYFPLVFFFLNL